MPQYQLNPEQLKVVQHPPGPILVFAGAGSGKTRVLTHRIAHLLENGASPFSVLAVTFTNKAAGEMKERIASLAGPAAKTCWIGTFHSISARILRREGRHLGYSENYTIYDTNDQKRLLKKVIELAGLHERKTPVSMLRARISDAKNQLITWEEYREYYNDLFADQIHKAYEIYQKELFKANAMDFDDLIMNTVLLLKKNAEVRANYQNRFKHVLVDEYQDTNMAQFHWVRLLSEKYKQIMVVGDDDQSIYCWRGADIRNILSFEEHFPGAAAFRLEQNYRSTPEILKAANAVINNNKNRRPKKLWTENPTGEKIDVYQMDDEVQEAATVAEQIQKRKKDRYADFCILYRTNAQSRALEDALRIRGMPYVIVGGLRFYERKEVKDILAYLYTIVNTADNLSLLRIINTPRRGIGNRTVELLEEFALDQSISLFQALEMSGEIPGLSAGAKKRLTDFHTLIAGFISRLKADSAVQIVESVIRDTKYVEELLAEQTDEAEERADNVNELIRAVESYTEREENAALDGFLQEVSLLTDIDTWDEKSDAVRMMTLHCAKGLEFREVFITGLEQGLFPLQRSQEDENDLEEERRLFYVGLTRAQKKAMLYYAFNRRRYGMDMWGSPSMFIEEMDPDAVVRHDRIKEEEPVFKPKPKRETRQAKPARMPAYEDFSQEEKVFRPGGYVRHPSWGNGTVLSVSGFGQDTKLVISFGGIQKKVMVKYANLEILD